MKKANATTCPNMLKKHFFQKVAAKKIVNSFGIQSKPF